MNSIKISKMVLWTTTLHCAPVTLEVKRQLEHEAEHSLKSNAKIKNVGIDFTLIVHLRSMLLSTIFPILWLCLILMHLTG
jgi:hypothetical protein